MAVNKAGKILERVGAKTPETKRWRLVSLEPTVALSIASQFPIRDLQDSRPPVLDMPEKTGPGAPALLSVADGPRVLSFRSVWISENNLDDLRPLKAQLQELRRMHPRLRRHPRVRFASPQGMIEGKVTGANITTMGAWPTGLPHRLVIELEITESPALVLEQTTQAPLETIHAHLVAGDLFEHLAQTFYGDARRGDLIRRVNPEIAPVEVGGGEVKILEPDHELALGNVTPYSIPFGERTRDPARYRSVLEALSARRVNEGGAWETLAEVLTGEAPT